MPILSGGIPAGGNTIPVITVIPGGSWYELLAIQRENRENVKREYQEGPQACPNDGEPLQWDPRSKRLRCRYDGWISPR